MGWEMELLYSTTELRLNLWTALYHKHAEALIQHQFVFIFNNIYIVFAVPDVIFYFYPVIYIVLIILLNLCFKIYCYNSLGWFTSSLDILIMLKC